MTAEFVLSGREYRMQAQGRATAASAPVEAGHAPHRLREWLRLNRERAAAARRNLSRAFHRSRAPEAAWLRENARLIQTARREVRESTRDFRFHPLAIDRDGTVLPRACLLAARYLDAADEEFSVEGLIAFLEGYQEKEDLDIGEISALRPALYASILERLSTATEDRWPRLITSLRQIADASWIDLLERVSVVEKVLRSDPAGAYLGMDSESRSMYRRAVAHIASHSDQTQREVAQTAIDLAKAEAAFGQTGRAAEKRRHVGFYLLDRGLDELHRRVKYRAPWTKRLRRILRRNGASFHIFGIEIVTLSLICILMGQQSAMYALIAALLLALPASQVAVDFMNHLAGLWRRSNGPNSTSPRVSPLTAQLWWRSRPCSSSENQVRDLVLDLEIRYLANRDRNLYFALLTDLADRDRKNDDRDGLVDLCRDLIDGLNLRYGADGRHPFFLLHRDRSFNEREGRWMGWERSVGNCWT